MQKCVAKRKCKFLRNYVKSDNILCHVCQNTAAHELNMLGKRWLFHFLFYSKLRLLYIYLFFVCIYIFFLSNTCICHALVNKVVCVVCSCCATSPYRKVCRAKWGIGSGETVERPCACHDIYPARPITTVSLATNTYCMMDGLRSLHTSRHWPQRPI